MPGPDTLHPDPGLEGWGATWTWLETPVGMAEWIVLVHWLLDSRDGIGLWLSRGPWTSDHGFGIAWTEWTYHVTMGCSFGGLCWFVRWPVSLAIATSILACFLVVDWGRLCGTSLSFGSYVCWTSALWLSLDLLCVPATWRCAGCGLVWWLFASVSSTLDSACCSFPTSLELWFFWVDSAYHCSAGTRITLRCLGSSQSRTGPWTLGIFRSCWCSACLSVSPGSSISGRIWTCGWSHCSHLAHGFPSEQGGGCWAGKAASRAQQAIKKLGVEALKKAIQEKDPWRALKGVGNSLGKPFQWIQYEELQRHIQAREQSAFKTKPQSKAGRAKPRSHTQSVTLSPETETLELYPTTFVDSDEMVVAPITFPEVTSNARGICVVTVDQAMQLGDVTASLSTDALAVVSIGELPILRPNHQATLQWPAFYLPTKEPVLVKGTLLNLGDDEVSIAKVEDAPAVASLDTEVIRVMICRDVFDKDWMTLAKGPIRTVISMLPALQPCTEDECSGQCKFFHAAIDEEVQNPVLDVWAWKWTAGENKPVKPDKAETFTAFIRIPLSAMPAVLQLSGWHGIFLEPRPASKQGSHPGYAVVWLPKAMTLTNALELKRRHDVVVGVARLAQKLVLHSLKKHEETLSAAIYPGKDLAIVSVQTIYEVGPLPHGLSHAQVAQLLKAWTWLAKPMRPNRSSDAGQFWDIGTSQAPPAAILHTEQGSVTVTVKKDQTPVAKTAPKIEASIRTRKHMLTAPTQTPAVSSQDPWLQADPWRHWKGSGHADAGDDSAGQEVIFTDGKSGNSQAAQSRLSAMEDRLMAQINKRLAERPPPGFDDPDTAKIKAEVTELQAQNQKFQTWFNDIGTRFVGVDSKLNAQHSRLEELGNAMNETRTATQALQKDMMTMSTTFRAELHASLESQTDAMSNKLEALIEKRMRLSWLLGNQRCVRACFSGLSLFRWLFWFLIVFFLPFADGFRFGEATHPGPCDCQGRMDSGISLAVGTANVAGLSNKVSVIMGLPPGLWGLTETHLTAPGFRNVQKAFRAESKQHGRNLRLVFGAPAPTRSIGSIAGTWTGVCTVSDFPAQRLPVTLPDDVYQSARALISSHHVGHINLAVGTVYGVAQSPSHRDPLAATRSILQAVSHQVVDQCRGPRCILGDFNCDVTQFPEMLYWHSLGWRDLQQHRLALCAHPVEATCKGSTVRDFVWCSPELLEFLESTSVLRGVLPDHSAVCGFFRFPETVPVSRYWPTPKPIPWEHVDRQAWTRFVDLTWSPFEWKGNPTKAFARWSSQMEQSLNGFVQVPHHKLPPGSCGRGQHLVPKSASVSQPKIKAARPGEEALNCPFPNKTLLKWYRQLRRLQSLLHGMRNGISMPQSWSYQTICWASIMRASGFGASFTDWWSHRPIQLQACPSRLRDLPSLPQLELMYEDFRLNFRHLEAWMLRQGVQQAKLKRENSLKVLFREFRPDPPASLDFLTKTRKVNILAVDSASATVLVNCSPVERQLHQRFTRLLWTYLTAVGVALNRTPFLSLGNNSSRCPPLRSFLTSMQSFWNFGGLDGKQCRMSLLRTGLGFLTLFGLMFLARLWLIALLLSRPFRRFFATVKPCELVVLMDGDVRMSDHFLRIICRIWPLFTRQLKMECHGRLNSPEAMYFVCKRLQTNTMSPTTDLWCCFRCCIGFGAISALATTLLSLNESPISLPLDFWGVAAVWTWQPLCRPPLKQLWNLTNGSWEPCLTSSNVSTTYPGLRLCSLLSGLDFPQVSSQHGPPFSIPCIVHFWFTRSPVVLWLQTRVFLRGLDVLCWNGFVNIQFSLLSPPLPTFNHCVALCG